MHGCLTASLGAAMLVVLLGREGGMNGGVWSSGRGPVWVSFLAQIQIWRLCCRLVELVTLDVG